jgi:predicted alpha/beta-hydrolase family hydrolase
MEMMTMWVVIVTRKGNKPFGGYKVSAMVVNTLAEVDNLVCCVLPQHDPEHLMDINYYALSTTTDEVIDEMKTEYEN